MSQPTEQFAYFSVTGTFDPQEITRRVGMGPTDSWRKGDVQPSRLLERKFSRWSLGSRLSSDRALEEHIADVLTQLNQNPSGFQAVAREFDGCMQLVGYFHEGYPGLHFDASLILGLATFGLSVDFDFYELWSDRREDT